MLLGSQDAEATARRSAKTETAAAKARMAERHEGAEATIRDLEGQVRDLRQEHEELGREAEAAVVDAEGRAHALAEGRRRDEGRLAAEVEAREALAREHAAARAEADEWQRRHDEVRRTRATRRRAMFLGAAAPRPSP